MVHPSEQTVAPPIPPTSEPERQVMQGNRHVESEQEGAPWRPASGETYVQSSYYEDSTGLPLFTAEDVPTEKAIALAAYVAEQRAMIDDGSLRLLPDDEALAREFGERIVKIAGTRSAVQGAE